MKRVQVTGVRQAGVIDSADPRPRENWALVKVMIAPMCTEFKGFVDGTGGNGYGHEAVGEVVAVAQPCRVKPGDRVVVQPGTACGRCELCHAGDYIHCEQWIDFKTFTGSDEGNFTLGQYILKPDWLLSPIPDGVSYEQAALTLCALGPSFGACELLGINGLDTVLIPGLGPVGLGAVVNARFRGARVIGLESNPYRSELARALGAERILNPADPDVVAQVQNLTGGKGVDKAIDCAGIPAAHMTCLEALRRKGQMAYVGWCTVPSPIVPNRHMIMKGLHLMGAWHYNLADFHRVLQVATQSPALKMVTHQFGLNQIQQAWETQVSGQCGKVYYCPWQ